MMVADEYPPAARLDIHLKDAKIISSYAQSVGAVTPLLDTTLQVYQQASDAGLGDLDAGALCRYLERLAGIQR
jgi:3-hydroxyisobutyrate dehydrogenase-like beta-hydroxyacid dehydrogenase